MTAVLDKVAAGELVARRQDVATNQLLSHALEQLLARSKRMRDAEAALMNMRLGGLRDRPRPGGRAHEHAAWRVAVRPRRWRQSRARRRGRPANVASTLRRRRLAMRRCVA